MDVWELPAVEAERARRGRLYHEFLRVPDLSAGLYVLDPGATDTQSPIAAFRLYDSADAGTPITGPIAADADGGFALADAGDTQRDRV